MKPLEARTPSAWQSQAVSQACDEVGRSTAPTQLGEWITRSLKATCLGSVSPGAETWPPGAQAGPRLCSATPQPIGPQAVPYEMSDEWKLGVASRLSSNGSCAAQQLMREPKCSFTCGEPFRMQRCFPGLCFPSSQHTCHADRPYTCILPLSVLFWALSSLRRSLVFSTLLRLSVSTIGRTPCAGVLQVFQQGQRRSYMMIY